MELSLSFDILRAMKKLLIFILLTHIGYGQYCPSLGPDQLLPCGVNSTTLTADLSQCGAGSNPNQTTGYSVASIPYVAQTNTGTQVFLGDDAVSQPQNIGFTFCFFGNTYTQFYIGSNGWIGFSGGQPATFASVAIPNMGLNVPKNCIMGPWQDWHPGIGGQIRYQTSGVAPCRKLTVSWIGVPMYLCTNLQGNFHIVIYESTNVIENHIQNKPNCPNWALGTAVQGIHNQPGTIGITVPGRNSTAWTTSNNSYRYTPNGPVVTPTLTWYQVGNPIPIATGVATITVTPPAGGANYTCHLIYPTCNAGWSTCNLGSGLGPDTVFVAPGPPNLNPLTVITTNPTCNGYCDGTIVVALTNGTAPYTYVWSPNANGTPTLSGCCDGTYSVLVTDVNGCTISATATITDPPLVTTGPITFNDTICFNSLSEQYSVPIQPGYTFNWSTVGNISSGQGTNTIDVDWNGISNGFIPGGVQVTAYNAVGCSSLPVSIDVYILNVLPVITPIGPFCSYDEFVVLSALPAGGTFTGTGVVNNDFYPTTANNISNTIIYTYIQSGCTFDTLTNIDVYPRPMITPITPSNSFFELCEGDSITETYTITWINPGYNVWTLLGQTTQLDNLQVTWDTPGMFDISVVHWANGCVSFPQTTTITISRCPEMLYYIPNTFTPDGDEHNNSWTPIFTSGFDPFDFHLTLYNRWGEIIFESFNSSDSWDGTYNNMPVQSGVYTWFIQYGDKNNDKESIIKGNVTIVR